MRYTQQVLAALIVATFLLPMNSLAQTTRTLNRIKVPNQASEATQKVKQSGKKLKKSVPLSKQIVERAVRSMLAEWNKIGLHEVLSERFQDRQRLLDGLDQDMARDARLHVLSVNSFQTIDQYLVKEKKAKGGEAIMSRVNVVVETQVEYNDANQGFQRLRGTNELIVRILHTKPKS
jgi:hypothetical protein